MPDAPTPQSGAPGATVINVPGPSANGAQWSSGGKPTGGTPGIGGSPAPPPGPQINPYVEPGPFGEVFVESMRWPGTVTALDGCETAEEWAVQKGTSGNFATTVWRGAKLAESIKVTNKVYGQQGYADMCALRDFLRPKRGKKPPSKVITNPQINWGGITRVAIKTMAFPKWQDPAGYWLFETELIEYNPSKTAPAGPADPAKPPGQPSPKDDGEAQLKKLLDEAAKA